MDNVQNAQRAPADTVVPTFSHTIRVLRDRARELLRLQNERLRELEGELEQQVITALERAVQAPREVSETEQAMCDRVETLERELRRLQQVRRESDQALDEARVMLGELEEERRILRDRLDELQTGTPPSPTPAPAADAEEVARLQRRLEMAMEEIRELKAEKEELTEKAKRPAASRAAEPVSGNFDWETQKKRLLEQLETSFDSHEPAQAKEKLRCEDVIRATERTVADKDRELAELRQQLELAERQPAAGPAEVASHHVEAAFDADELIQNERKKLAELQNEWQEKLRRAEIEISIERAKLARERLHIEERLRAAESHAPAASSGDSANGDPKDKSPSRGRWLARLGLSGDKDGEGS